jgi:peptide/nickel transport system permease protein
MIYASRVPLLVGITAAAIFNVIGLVVGLVTSYYGGKLDVLSQIVVNVAFAIPILPLVVLINAGFGASTWNIIAAMSAVYWTFTVRYIRPLIFSIKQRTFIEASRAIGLGNFRIMYTHILPNVLPLTLTNAGLSTAGAILLEAGIGFVGVGDPAAISWGSMLFQALSNGAVYLNAWNYIIPPGLAITFLVLSIVLVVQAFDEVLSPRLRVKR